jgi:hypothetical protein
MGFLDTFMKYVFRFFQPFHSRLALKLAKSANVSKEKMLQKIGVGNIKRKKMKKMQKNSPNRSYMPKIFAHGYKSQKLHLFFADNFSHMSLLQLFQVIRIQHQILHFVKNIFSSSYKHFLQALKSNADKTAQKNVKIIL